MDCLVTKLKATVDNEFLLPIGYSTIAEFKDPVELQQTETVQFYTNNEKLKLLGNGYFIIGGSNVGKETYWNSGSQTTNGVHIGGKAIIIGKYDDMRVYMKVTGAERIDIDEALLAANPSNISSITFEANNIGGSIENTRLGRFAYLTVKANSSSTLTGNIENINRISTSELRQFRLYNHPYVTGRVENFLNNIKQNAADNTGSNKFNVYITNCPNITYNGQNIVGILTGNLAKVNGEWTGTLSYSD